jgi:uncharacterized protein YfaT (DUF1175 family)
MFVVVLGGIVALVRVSAPVPQPQVTVEPSRILADGFDSANILVQTREAPHITLVEKPRGTRVEEPVAAEGGWKARVYTGVMPGRITWRVETKGARPVTGQLAATLAGADSAEDGIPDFLRLEGDDRVAFRRWFTFLAEAQYFQSPNRRPDEINDCAALIRYAYREALRGHDSVWAKGANLPLVPPFASVGKYQYPYTPLGAGLFRVTAGPFRAADLGNGAFAQFADARNLRRNTHLISRDLARAESGDILFFRQDGGHMPFHSMIYLGESYFQKDGRRYVVYHTGPETGEIKRLTMEQLIAFPQPEWRPLSANPFFLGVYRWNILRKVAEP